MWLKVGFIPRGVGGTRRQRCHLRRSQRPPTANGSCVIGILEPVMRVDIFCPVDAWGGVQHHLRSVNPPAPTPSRRLRCAIRGVANVGPAVALFRIAGPVAAAWEAIVNAAELLLSKNGPRHVAEQLMGCRGDRRATAADGQRLKNI